MNQGVFRMKVRQDAWSHEDDLLLAETVLRHIREGSTQLNAFEEVGDKLNRTSAACGFRWNAEVRKMYHQAMELAKKQRKQLKRALASQAQQIKTVQAQMPVKTNDVAPQEPAYHYQNESEILTRQVEIQEEAANGIDLDSVIAYLHSVKTYGVNSQILQSENVRLTRENKQLLDEKDKLERKLQRLNQENSIIQEDYQALVQIMDRARRMVSFTNDGDQNPQIFVNNQDSDYGQIAK